MAENPKPIDSISLVMSLMDFFKGAAIVLGITIIEWAKAKQAHAEDVAETAKSDLATLKAQNEVDKANENKSPDTIIRDFLDGGN